MLQDNGANVIEHSGSMNKVLYLEKSIMNCKNNSIAWNTVQFN